jgi:transcriptional regulator with XRE-family HTH domain
MRSFDNIAKLIKNKRVNHPKGYSQSELSSLLGYKNGQFISNVERALCNVPLKMLGRVSEVLDINPDDLKRAIMSDLDNTLENYFKQSSKKTQQTEITKEVLDFQEDSTNTNWKQAA